MKVVITYGELMNKCYDWNKACDIIGVNPWLLNEGRADPDDTISLTLEEAKSVGILQDV